MRNSNDQLSGLAIGGIVVVVVLVCWGVIFGVSSLTARWTPEPGQIGVVREGSSFWWIGDWRNGHGIKKVVPPGAGNTEGADPEGKRTEGAVR